MGESPLPGQLVKIQTESGDIYLPEVDLPSADLAPQPPDQTILNKGIEFFKVKFPDLPGSAQWTVLRNSRSVKVDMLHQN